MKPQNLKICVLHTYAVFKTQVRLHQSYFIIIVGVKIQRITACENKWDSWQVGYIQFGGLTEEWSRSMGKQQTR